MGKKGKVSQDELLLEAIEGLVKAAKQANKALEKGIKDAEAVVKEIRKKKKKYDLKKMLAGYKGEMPKLLW
jgi:predicted nucleotide-binding protein (sugar kinase/HSP70/actin superfamily)